MNDLLRFKVHRLRQKGDVDLHDTRQFGGGDPRPRTFGLVFPVCDTPFKVGRVGRVSSSTFFGVTLIRYRSRPTPAARSSLLPPVHAGGGRGGPVSSGVKSAVPHALRTRRETYPAMFVTVVGKCGQALKGAWWMSWHREATKDVVACDKLREAGKRASIRRFLNEETQPGSHPVTPR